MKKSYIICFLFLVLLCYGAYKISYLVTVDKYKDDVEKNIIQLATVDTKTENQNQISPLTKYTFETYNINTNDLTYEVTQGPVKYLGYTRDMLKNELKNKVWPENVLKIEILNFTKEEVVVRKTIAYEINSKYFVKAIDETLVIYENDKETVYDYANIDVENMPEDLVKQLNLGMYIDTTEDLYEFLQNYSS